MNSSNILEQKYNDSDIPCYRWPSDEYCNEHEGIIEEKELIDNNQNIYGEIAPEDITDVDEYMGDNENKVYEVHKDDFVSGFVTNHNHGSVDYTSVADGHVHQCLDVTYPPKQLKDGTHIHYTRGYTVFEDRHHHYYEAWSGPAIPVGKGMHVHYYEFYTTVNEGHKHQIKGVDMPAPGDM